jgi:hypothetical protein
MIVSSGLIGLWKLKRISSGEITISVENYVIERDGADSEMNWWGY